MMAVRSCTSLQMVRRMSTSFLASGEAMGFVQQ